MSLDEIHAAIPHREPFLLVDEIVQCDERHIVCLKTFRQDEWWVRGHYPHFPLIPGVLLCEAAMQAGGVLLSQIAHPPPGSVPVVTRMADVRFKSMVRPGDTILMEVRLIERLGGAFFFSAQVTSGGRIAVRFQFACTLTEPQG